MDGSDKLFNQAAPHAAIGTTPMASVDTSFGQRATIGEKQTIQAPQDMAERRQQLDKKTRWSDHRQDRTGRVDRHEAVKAALGSDRGAVEPDLPNRIASETGLRDDVNFGAAITRDVDNITGEPRTGHVHC